MELGVGWVGGGRLAVYCHASICIRFFAGPCFHGYNAVRPKGLANEKNRTLDARIRRKREAT
jgi:hypothetical protein